MGGGMNLKRRVGRLEKEMHVATEIRRWRIVVTSIRGLEEPGDGAEEPFSRAEEPLGLQNCDRHFHNGLLSETVWINGSQGSIPDEEIERFVESFPIRGLPPNQQFRVAGRGK